MTYQQVSSWISGIIKTVDQGISGWAVKVYHYIPAEYNIKVTAETDG